MAEAAVTVVTGAPKRRKKQGPPPPPPPYTREFVESLKEPDGWGVAYKLIRDHRIKKTETMQTLQEFKQLLLNHLERQEPIKNPLDSHGITDLIAVKRAHVKRIYDQLKEFTRIKQFTESFRARVNERVENGLDKLNSNLAELETGKCRILVAGETGAGKSSFINLLIGVDILPVDDALSTTSCICEIHHGTTKEVYATTTSPSPSGTAASLVTRHHTDLSNKSVEEVQEILAVYAHEERDKTDGLKYEKIEIYWPIPFLRAGLYLVDSPGLGETTIMNERTKSYVQGAIAFIYLLNSEAAGGFTEGRLDTLLSMNTAQTDQSELQNFDPRSALFIFNKWDKITEEVRERIRERVLKRLCAKWPELDVDRQVHYLSVTVAKNFQVGNIGIPPEYKKFLEIFSSFLETGLEIMIKHHIRWLDHFMNNAETCVKTPLTLAKLTGRSNHEKMGRISDCLRKLRFETRAVVEKLHEKLEEETRAISFELCKHLKSPDTFEKLKKGAMAAELPTEVDMKLNKALARDIIRQVLKAETSDWEDKRKLIQAAREGIRTQLIQEFNIISDELSKIENEMKGSSSFVPEVDTTGTKQNFRDRVDHVFSSAEKMVIGLTSPLWMPLAVVAGILMAPIVGSYSLVSQITAKYRLVKFNKSREEAIKKWLTTMIDKLTEEGVSRDLVRDEMKVIYDFIMQFQLSVPAIINNSEKLIDDARNSQATATQTLAKYDPLRQMLDTAFGLRNLYYYEYLLCKEKDVYTDMKIIQNLEFLASGTFADVYKATMEQDVEIHGLMHNIRLHQRAVAVKKFKKFVDETSITDMILEREILCNRSKHINIIDMYATVCTREEGGLRMMFILELCDETLKQAIFEHDERVPAKQTEPTARRAAVTYVLDKLIGICHGLNYLHASECIHRDLKLDNILLKDEVVKLADLGQNKGLDDVVKYIGTPKYTDPNILKQKNVHYEADIYSLAMVLWECWFGTEVYDSREWNDELAEDIKNGYRPSFHVTGCVEPFQSYVELVKQCWTEAIYTRPEVETVEEVLVRMRDEVVNSSDGDSDWNQLKVTWNKERKISPVPPGVKSLILDELDTSSSPESASRPYLPTTAEPRRSGVSFSSLTESARKYSSLTKDQELESLVREQLENKMDDLRMTEGGVKVTDSITSQTSQTSQTSKSSKSSKSQFYGVTEGGVKVTDSITSQTSQNTQSQFYVSL